MQAEIVSIGSELLLGQIVDTNAPLIARQLAALGLDLFHKATVGDNLARATDVLHLALQRVDVVITTGGLGPTADDVTREAVAAATGRDLVFVPELWADIEAFFAARGLAVSPSNRRQAYIPRGAIPLPNPVGTAPCFIVEQGERCLASLPGVPREMEHLLLQRVVPYLRTRYGLSEAIVFRTLRVCGLGESRIGEILGDYMSAGANPTVGTLAHLGQVDVRIAAKGADLAAATARIAPVEAEVRARLGDLIFGVDAETLEGVVGERLAARGWTLGLLEVGTGGAVAQRLSAVPGLPERFHAAVTASEASARGLGLTDGGAAGLAESIRGWAKGDAGVAVLLGPPEDAGARGTTYPARIAVAGAGGVDEQAYRLGGDLAQARVRAAVIALDRLRRALAS